MTRRPVRQECEFCGSVFYRSTVKQRTCSVRCGARLSAKERLEAQQEAARERKTAKQVIQVLDQPRCIDCFGIGRVPGLAICEVCLDQKPIDLINRKLKAHPEFLKWWVDRHRQRQQPQPKTRKPLAKVERASMPLAYAILVILRESDRPLLQIEIMAIAMAKSPGRWKSREIFYQALRWLRQEGKVGFTPIAGNNGRPAYKYFSIEQGQEGRQSA